MRVVFASDEERADAVSLSLALWPEHTVENMTAEMRARLSDHDSAVFLVYNDTQNPHHGKTKMCNDKQAIGIAICSLRHDYVEGTETSPVGYLEGIYVTEAYRRQGAARALLAACEKWSKDMGCTEFASDCELDNTDSLAFHLKNGFSEANRIICFCKKLKQTERGV